MEVLAMASSHNPFSDPSYQGNPSNMYSTGSRQQQRQVPQHLAHPMAASFSGHSHSHSQGALSSQSTDFAEGQLASPDLNMSWENFGAGWQGHPRPVEHLNSAAQSAALAQLQIPPNMHLAQAQANANFTSDEHALLGASRHLPSNSPMDYSLSTSVSPGPEIMSQDTFTSPLTPASFDPEIQPLQARHTHPQMSQGRSGSTPSPNRPSESPELLHRRSMTTGAKAGTAAASKVSKSPQPGSVPAPANSRSAHSAIERKYRENINNKILELHKVLCSARAPLFPDHEAEPGGYPYARLPRPEEEDAEGGDTGSSSSQSTLPAKKADVLAGAVAYVRRSEREKQALMEQLGVLTARLQSYEQMMAQARARNMA